MPVLVCTRFTMIRPSSSSPIAHVCRFGVSGARESGRPAVSFRRSKKNGEDGQRSFVAHSQRTTLVSHAASSLRRRGPTCRGITREGSDSIREVTTQRAYLDNDLDLTWASTWDFDMDVELRLGP